MHAKLVLTAHAFMHGEAQRYGCFFSGLYGRRTDDSAWRSAPLQQLDTRLAQNRKWLISNITNPEYTFNRLLKTHRTMIDAGLVKLSARRACDLGFEGFTPVTCYRRYSSYCHHNCTNDDCWDQPSGSFWSF
ncbi:MAG TPA: hypothetical protein PLQ56_16645 [Aggregatilineales bacterium]|nr:hypothetical protein [Aggregatilineales bacterium]